MPLYPSIAVSDAYMAAAHYAAAATLYQYSPNAAVGFALVAVAASFGVLRFGVNEKCFAPINEALANSAGMVGLPLVGLYAQSLLRPALLPRGVDPVLVAGSLVALKGIAAGLPNGLQELLKIVLNLVCFIGPLAAVGYTREDVWLLGAVSAFVIGGVLVGPERHKCLFGVRRENWFHYILGTATYVIALRLTL